MRIIFSLFLFAHALAHLPYALVEWRLIANGSDIQYRRTILGGRVYIGAGGARLLGFTWLAAGAAVGLAATYFLLNTAGAWSIGWMAVAFSSIMTIVGWPDAKGGAVLNAVAVAFLAWVTVFNR